MTGFESLFFEKDLLPAKERKLLQDDAKFITEDDGLTCCLYLLHLGYASQVARHQNICTVYLYCNVFLKAIKEITGRPWREVLGQGFIFMWARVLDQWLKGVDSKWWDQGGSDAFYRSYNHVGDAANDNDDFNCQKEKNWAAAS